MEVRLLKKLNLSKRAYNFKHMKEIELSYTKTKQNKNIHIYMQLGSSEVFSTLKWAKVRLFYMFLIIGTENFRLIHFYSLNLG